MFYIDEINSYLSRRERLRIKKKCKKWANNTTKRKKKKNMKIHFARSIDFSIRTFPELSGFIVHLPQTMLLLRHKMNDNLQLNLHNNFSSFYWALFFSSLLCSSPSTWMTSCCFEQIFHIVDFALPLNLLENSQCSLASRMDKLFFIAPFKFPTIAQKYKFISWFSQLFFTSWCSLSWSFLNKFEIFLTILPASIKKNYSNFSINKFSRSQF